MIVCRTVPELLSALLPANQTVAKVGVNKKLDGKLHQGHFDTIARAANLADLALINFWSWQPVFLDAYPLATMPDDYSTWSEQYCLDFVESAGADIVFIPDPLLHQQLNIDFPAILNSAESVITDNNYDTLISQDLDFLRLRIGLEESYNTNKFYKKSVQVDTWKDGYKALCLAHYINTYTSYTCDLAEPTRRPDGIPYSSKIASARPDFLDFVIDCNNTLMTFPEAAVTFDWDIDQPNLPPEYLHLITSYIDKEVPFSMKVYDDAAILGNGKRFIELMVIGYHLMDESIVDNPIRLTYMLDI